MDYKNLVPTQGSGSSVPSGTILSWWGNIISIPTGFLLCDGTNGTPDLRGRTLIGSGNWSDAYGTTIYTIGGVGGERLHKLTVAEMPSHNHSISPFTNQVQLDGPNREEAWLSRFEGSINTSYTGGDQPHNNMQPYMTVHWIIKI